MHRIHAHRGRDRSQQGHEYEHRAEDVHHHPNREQDEVEQDQELPVLEVLALDPFDHHRGDFFLLEEFAQRQCHDHDHEEGTEEHAGLAEDGGNGTELERPVQPDLDHDGVRDADRSGFNRIEDSAVDAAEDQEREH